jgi:glycosyltransferase involved in cell wall biosynthesis
MNILFLYSELAGYSIACMKKVIELYPNVKIIVIRWPVNKEAPFQFDFGAIEVHEKNTFSEEQLITFVKEINPTLIVCSGWMDKTYVKICQIYKGKIPTVLTLDNHWRGDLKQRLAQVLSPFFIKSRFSHAWVPGEKQYVYAKKLGFKGDKVKKGFYSADVDLFINYRNRLKTETDNHFPKRLLYVGRYVKHKGIFDLWKAFIELQVEQPNDWELWCVGTGDQWGNRVEHPKIKHLGFLQPNEFDEVINQTSVYVLPSHFEPWGVSLHEFVSAGYPVICSHEVGSSEQFLKNYENGYLFSTGDISQLKSAMLKVMKLNNESFSKMQIKSIELSQTNTPFTWAKTLMDFIQ